MIYTGTLFKPRNGDSTQYITASAGIALPNADWSIGMIFHVRTGYIDTPLASSSNHCRPYRSSGYSGGTGGNDCHFAWRGGNYGSAGNSEQMRLRARIASGAQVAATNGTEIIGTTRLAAGKTYLAVYQRNGSAIELKLCEVGGALTTEFSGTYNTNFGARTISAPEFFRENFAAGGIAAWWAGSKALSDTEIQNIAAGTDIETIYSAGQRIDLFVFDRATTITSTWSAKTATFTGDWSLSWVGAPRLQNASAYITATEPLHNTPVALPRGQNTVAYACSGTYVGFTPTSIEARLLDGLTLTQVQGWTALTGQTISGGNWSGSLTIPGAAWYRVEFRDAGDPTKVYSGRNIWVCAPVVCLIGQSPMANFSVNFRGAWSTGSNNLLHQYQFNGCPWEPWITNSTLAPAGIAGISNELAAFAAGKPVYIIPAAWGGTSSTDWATKNPTAGAPAKDIWTDMLAQFTAANNPKHVQFFWLNGSSDSGYSDATIKANHDTILANLRTDLTTGRGITLTYAMVPHNRQTNATDANMDAVRKSQWSWATSHAEFGTAVFTGPSWTDMRLDSEFSVTATAGGASTVTLPTTDSDTNAEYYIPTGSTIEITAGTGAGQSRTSTAYNGTTRVVTVGTAWTTVPDATSVVRVSGTSPHPTAVACRSFGARMARVIGGVWGWSSVSGLSPTISGVQRIDATTLKAVIQHKSGSGLKTTGGGTSLVGWEVSANGSTWAAATSATITGANEVTIISPSAVTVGVSKVRYMYGQPVSTTGWQSSLPAILFDNSGVGLEGGLPVQFSASDIGVTDPISTFTATGFFAAF